MGLLAHLRPARPAQRLQGRLVARAAAIARQQLQEGVAQVGGRFGIIVLWQQGGLALDGISQRVRL